MSRILAIDYGTRRVGIAVTDPNQIIASPLKTIAPNELDLFLKEYLANEEVHQVILGYPLKEDGSPTDLTHQVDQLAIRIAGNFPGITVIKHDERYTSKMAKQSMIDAGFSKKARRNKSNVDKISATLILQSYMEERNVAS